MAEDDMDDVADEGAGMKESMMTWPSSLSGRGRSSPVSGQTRGREMVSRRRWRPA
jgi:hypothetical protein